MFVIAKFVPANFIRFMYVVNAICSVDDNGSNPPDPSSFAILILTWSPTSIADAFETIFDPVDPVKYSYFNNVSFHCN